MVTWLMTFVDSNVPMYLVGGPHPNKDRAAATVERLRQDGETFVTDVDVYQEIIHRYTSIRRFNAINEAFAWLNSIVSDVLSYDVADVYAARDIIADINGLSARDALHVAVMRRAGVNRIFSYDRGFDLCPGIIRIE